jgi:CheY-like chemotaxis protein
MGGAIHVDSELGTGSTFHVTLPLPAARQVPAPLPVANLAVLRGRRVLIVDDSATNRRILHDAVVGWGMRPTLADGSCAALTIIAEAVGANEAFEIILLDYQMPEMNGLDLADEIRRRFQRQAPIVMMLSSVARAGDSARCAAAGITLSLTKPVRQAALLKAILTAVAAVAVERVADYRDRVAAPSDAPNEAPRILVAEDNAINQRIVHAILTKRGFHVTTAGSGRVAVDAALSERFDLILMDVQMPDLDGFEATSLIRAAEAASGSRTPILALTAHAMKGDREACLKVGMDGYVSKPVKAAELLASIESWLGLAAAGRDRALIVAGSAEIPARSMA